MSRVWKVLTDQREFGEWFRVAPEGMFVAPEWRRAEAFRMNLIGWAQQMENVRSYVQG